MSQAKFHVALPAHRGSRVSAGTRCGFGCADTAAGVPGVGITGLVQPTVVRFSPDGRVFVAEKGGLIKVFDDLDDPTPSTYADLRIQVHDYWDRGLLGMALAPTFPVDPSVYVLYTRDAALGGTAPRWTDACPTPPGPTTEEIGRAHV